MCFAFALHCAGHFVVDESNQDPNKSGTLMLGTLSLDWKLGTPKNLQPCNPGNLQLSNLGTLPNFGTLPDDIAALEPWNLLLGCKAGLICQKWWLDPPLSHTDWIFAQYWILLVEYS